MDEIIIRNLTKDYKNKRGIFNLSLRIKKGSCMGLVGTNGSGKTTTMRLLMGFINQDAGTAIIRNLDSMDDAMEIKRIVGYVPGNINFPDVGTAKDFFKLEADALGIKDNEYINYLIDLFKLDINVPLRKMSKGMKQKTALIRAFMVKPQILLLDEPSTGLDPVMRDALINLINEYKHNGSTIFMSSHVFKEIEDTCDSVAFIEKGHLIDLIDVNSYDGSNLDEFEIGFNKESDLYEFNKKYKTSGGGLDVVLDMDGVNINNLFKDLSKYNVRYLNKVNHSLEWYYNKLMMEEIKYA